jgi:hypothetical protein
MLRISALRRATLAAPIAALVFQTGCVSGEPATAQTTPSPSPSASSTPAPTTASPTGPAGWNRYQDADFGWSVYYPPDWTFLSSASTRQEKYFVTNDPKIDINQRNFNLRPGDYEFDVLVDAVPPSSCLDVQQNPGQTSTPIRIDSMASTLYHWTNSVGSSVYVASAVSRGHCHRFSGQFVGGGSTREKQSWFEAVLGTFRFGS